MAYPLTSWFSSILTGQATKQGKGVQNVSPSSSGVIKPKPVTIDAALQVSAVYACIKLLTETVSSIPLKVYDRDGERLVEDVKSPLANVLTRSPNSLDTPVEFKETLMLNLNTAGNAYAAKIYNKRNEILAIEPLASGQMRVEMADNNQLVYEYTANGNRSYFTADQIIHLRYMGNGILGLNPLDYAAGTISNQLASDDFANQFYLNGAKPSGVLSTDLILDPNQYNQMISRFRNLNEGTQNSHKTLLLEGGLKYQQVQLSPESMQMLETKQFNLEEIARFYGVPSILINDNKNTTTWGSGIEQIMIGWLNTGLTPLLTRIEQRFERTLLTPIERTKKVIRFDTADFIRSDAKGMAEFISKLVSIGVMTRNEGRTRLNLAPVEGQGADELTAQLNLTPIDQLGKQNEPAPAATTETEEG